MIKNEEQIIERCLRAALPHVDAVVLCYNGTDRTVEIAERVLRERWPDIGTGRFHFADQPWKDFGHNRTLSAAAAKTWVQERHPEWPLDTTYLLFLDADHVLVSNGFDRAQLTEPHYHLAQGDSGMQYYNTRLARLDREWRCIGVTHEYWSPSPDVQPARLKTLWIDDRGDGGSKADKHERDARLLSEDLEKDPGNVRSQFYLAQALWYLGRYAEAADRYAQRMRGGGYWEEKWFAAYRYGETKLKLGADKEGVAALLDAWEQCPHRSEPLVTLATHYREKGKNNLALMLAERAIQIPYPHGDTLFVDPHMYRSWPLKEIIITSYYCGKPERGMQAAEAVLAERGLASVFYDEMGRNQTFYLRNLPVVRRGRFPIPEGLDAKYGMPYFGTNPTLVPHGPGYVAHVRLVNYKQTNGRHYEAAEGVFRTRGAVMGWSPDDGVLTEPREVDVVMPEGWDDVRINGLEDVRWVRHAERVWFTATCCQVPGAGGWPRVVLGLMTPDLCGVERVLKLDYGKQGESDREKNWVPWSHRGELLLIYSYDPLVIVLVDTETGACTEVQRWQPPFRAARWKGSTTPVLWASADGDTERLLLLVHETAYMLGSDNQWAYSIYSHRFVELSAETLTITRYSRPFTWERPQTSGPCIEYATGLAWGHDQKLIVTYGVEDREAAWAEVEAATVETMLSEKRLGPDSG